MFADLFSSQGRRSVPPSVVATVMVLQRLEGLSDREPLALRGRVGSYDGGRWGRFAHTVLVDMRARLDAPAADPKRIFDLERLDRALIDLEVALGGAGGVIVDVARRLDMPFRLPTPGPAGRALRAWTCPPASGTVWTCPPAPAAAPAGSDSAGSGP